jgi:hypothetical protein
MANRESAEFYWSSVAALLASPILIPVGVIFLARIRRLEKTDPEINVRVDQAYSDDLEV